MNELQIKTEYINWKLTNQDMIVSTTDLWPFSDNEKYCTSIKTSENTWDEYLHKYSSLVNTYIREKKTYPIFNTKDFINKKYVKLYKIGDTGYIKMLQLLDFCWTQLDKDILDFFHLDKVNDREYTGIVSYLNKLREYMSNELSINDLTLINERFYIKTIGPKIQFYPVYDNNSFEPNIRVIPAFILLFTSTLSNLFIRQNTLHIKNKNKSYFDDFYFLTNIRIFK